MNEKYKQLSTSSDLSVASLEQAVKESGGQTHYMLHVTPPEANYAHAVCGDYPNTVSFSVISDKSLNLHEWFIRGATGTACVGSRGP